MPKESIVPVVELPPTFPLTDQITPAMEPLTEAVNWVVLPEATVAVEGETVTVMACVEELPPPHPATNRIPHSNGKTKAKILCM